VAIILLPIYSIVAISGTILLMTIGGYAIGGYAIGGYWCNYFINGYW